jgi:quercetin dioxygenase-like cupin family protein
MNIHLAGSRPTRRAPKEYFTGTVWQDPIIASEAPARVVANRVSFEPGARTAWHTHPLGQTLYVVSGVGRVQTKGVARCARSSRATSSGFRPVRNIGMALRRPMA